MNKPVNNRFQYKSIFGLFNIRNNCDVLSPNILGIADKHNKINIGTALASTQGSPKTSGT